MLAAAHSTSPCDVSAAGGLPGRPIRWYGRGRPPGYTPTGQTCNVVLRPPGRRPRRAVDSAPAFAVVGRRFAFPPGNEGSGTT
jgi:hypothetical protein